MLKVRSASTSICLSDDSFRRSHRWMLHRWICSAALKVYHLFGLLESDGTGLSSGVCDLTEGFIFLIAVERVDWWCVLKLVVLD